MIIGKLRQRIEIQNKGATTRNSLGEEVPSWPTLATVWAAVYPLQGREFLEGQVIEAAITHRVVMRYRAGVTTAMRIKFGTRIFQVHAVLNIEERSRELHLMCSEIMRESEA